MVIYSYTPSQYHQHNYPTPYIQQLKYGNNNVHHFTTIDTTTTKSPAQTGTIQILYFLESLTVVILYGQVVSGSLMDIH